MPESFQPHEEPQLSEGEIQARRDLEKAMNPPWTPFDAEFGYAEPDKPQLSEEELKERDEYDRVMNPPWTPFDAEFGYTDSGEKKPTKPQPEDSPDEAGK
jgi:hypothetical protein